MDFALIHNGATNVPQKRTPEGKVVPDAPLSKMHDAARERVQEQVAVGVQAEDLGFEYVFFTEHHFQPTGSEFSTNPMMSQIHVAAETERIRLGQLANIITWHDPVRFAEQASILDILSGGRAEIGIGRGYQPRENEVLGQYWDGTIQDQERNRTGFKEKFEIINRCWSEDLVSYHGANHQIPPEYTKWHHDLDHAYFDDEVTEQSVTDVMDWNEDGDLYSDLWNQVMSGGTTLKKIAVFPQPVQKPHPQLWMPTTSHRSIRFAASHGVNGGFLPAPNDVLSDMVDIYFETAEAAGWPDRREEYMGEPLRYGWDPDAKRGVIPFRYIWNTDVASEESTKRWKMGQENIWNYYRPLLPVTGVFDVEEGEWIPGEMIFEHEQMLVGSTEEIIEAIATIMEEVGYDGFAFGAFFETPGIKLEEEEAQMESFADDVMPYLREQFPY
jgi:alkanesulfonate monooxygenase SsuD/methylene tetrahydromethanopterin reductase-like flavin-dependent oxidoreductase (luciferase family)